MKWADPSAFSERYGIERAVQELVRGGLLFRADGAVLPTRTALYLSGLEMS